MNKCLVGAVVVVLLLVVGVVARPSNTEFPNVQPVPVPIETTLKVSKQATERFSARVDRVEVQFEHWDYTRYRLQTNDLVREGDMNSERGFETDPNATVVVLNWQKPIGEQIRYVRLTAEPNFLYILDSDNKIIPGSKLTQK